MTKEQVIKRIRAEIKQCGTQSIVADGYGISAQHLSDMLAGKRALRGKVLAGLGLELVETFRAVKR